MIKRLVDLVSSFSLGAKGTDAPQEHSLPEQTPFMKLQSQLQQDVVQFLGFASKAGIAVKSSMPLEEDVFHIALQVEGNAKPFHMFVRDNNNGTYGVKAFPLTQASAHFPDMRNNKTANQQAVLDTLQKFLYVNVLTDDQRTKLTRVVVQEDIAKASAGQITPRAFGTA